MHGHLVPVEVGVERRANQRVDLDRAALHQNRLERLDAEPVQSGCAVEQDRVVLDHLFEDVPDLRAGAFGHPLGALDVMGVALHDERVHYQRLEQLKRHALGKTALVQFQLRADDDD